MLIEEELDRQQPAGDCWCGYNALAIRPPLEAYGGDGRTQLERHGPCPFCAMLLAPGHELCDIHLGLLHETWAAENRAYCDFIHRGVEMPRLSKWERERDLDWFRIEFAEEEDPV